MNTKNARKALNPVQLAKLRACHTEHGRNAKDLIRQAWETRNYRYTIGEDKLPELQQIRNKFGRSWLCRITLRDL